MVHIGTTQPAVLKKNEDFYKLVPATVEAQQLKTFALRFWGLGNGIHHRCASWQDEKFCRWSDLKKNTGFWDIFLSFYVFFGNFNPLSFTKKTLTLFHSRRKKSSTMGNFVPVKGSILADHLPSHRGRRLLQANNKTALQISQNPTTCQTSFPSDTIM